MKRLISLTIIALAVVCIVFSCKKEKQSTTDPIDTSKITFGNTEGMDVVTFDTLLLTDAPHNGNIYTIGLLPYIDSTTYSYPVTRHLISIEAIGGATMRCFDNIELLGEFFDEETYYLYDTAYIQHDNYVEALLLLTYTKCGPYDEYDSMFVEEKFRLFTNDESAQMNIDDNFLQVSPYDEINIFKNDYEFSASGSVINDTVYSPNWNYVYHCINIPTGKPQYIGFKLTKNGRVRLGWVKVEVVPTAIPYEYNFKIIETAIQK